MGGGDLLGRLGRRKLGLEIDRNFEDLVVLLVVLVIVVVKLRMNAMAPV